MHKDDDIRRKIEELEQAGAGYLRALASLEAELEGQSKLVLTIINYDEGIFKMLNSKPSANNISEIRDMILSLNAPIKKISDNIVTQKDTINDVIKSNNGQFEQIKDRIEKHLNMIRGRIRAAQSMIEINASVLSNP